MLSVELKNKIINRYIDYREKKSNLSELKFIFSWYTLLYSNGKHFGFKDGGGFDEQLQQALDYFIAIDSKRRNIIINDKENVRFIDFFIKNSQENGLDLPSDFGDKIIKTMEEL